ncbi:hypothetical protein [Sphingomonas gellani]|uniref:hypothetical protein n=1 Tax=Sphingomonas gellani TaxID=1166340 RepID=UPI0011137B4E|nr:hypothetical protein [Sphingomonas gellani]
MVSLFTSGAVCGLLAGCGLVALLGLRVRVVALRALLWLALGGPGARFAWAGVFAVLSAGAWLLVGLRWAALVGSLSAPFSGWCWPFGAVSVWPWRLGGLLVVLFGAGLAFAVMMVVFGRWRLARCWTLRWRSCRVWVSALSG